MAGKMQVSIGQKTATQEFLTLYVSVFHFYTHQKVSEKLCFSDIFRGYINGTLGHKGLSY